MKRASGSHTGNGSTQNLTALGIPAGLVFIKGPGTIASIWCSAMPAGSFKPATGSTALTTTNGITQHPLGFSVGSDPSINANGVVYDWWALGDTGAGDFSAVSYTGNATDNRNLAMTGLASSPDAAFVLGDTAQPTAWRLSTMSGDSSGTFGTSLTTNIIQAFASGQIQLGTSAIVNGNGITYYAMAFKAPPGILAVVTYTGNGVDGTNITGAGLTPDDICPLKSASTDSALWYPKRFTTDTCHDLSAAADASDRIQGRVPDGLQVGANVRANANGVVYHALLGTDGETTPAAAAAPSSALALLGVG